MILVFQGAVLDEESNTDRSETENKKRAWECIIESLPHFVRKSYASTWVEDQCLMVFRCLQYPVFNKQVLNKYLLLFPQHFKQELFNINLINFLL